MKKLMLLMIAGILAMSSCKKDEPSIIIDPPIDTTRTFVDVNTSVAGKVMDEAGNAVADARIDFGQKTAMTDDNGIFKIDNAIVKENRAYVKVTKDGYFHGSRTYFAKKDQRAFVNIQLLEKSIQGTVNASGGTVTLPEGVKLDFPANAVADANGNPYSGTVEVAAQYLDPTASNINDIMPGDLLGITTENREEGLTSYGMVAVELLSPSGELLNVADGKTVTLTMPVASSQTSAAPSEIPLWYFDEEVGVWKEEGKATLQGGEYVGEVSHFTYWNCDINWDLIYLDGTVLFEGSPLSNVVVALTMVDGPAPGSTRSSMTTEAGVYSGQVPTGTAFVLEVWDNCGTSIYTDNIGPFTEDVTIDPINIDPTLLATSYATITGTITNCDNDPITNGYAFIEAGGIDYFAYTNDGTIDYTFLYCNSTDVTMTAVDIDAAKQSDPVSFAGANSIDFGTLQACEQLAEFISFDLDGVNYLITEYVSHFDSTGTMTLFGNDNNGLSVWIESNATGTGTFAADCYISVSNVASSNANTTFNITYTQFSTVVDETVTGSFSGEVATQGGNAVPITGDFKAINEF